MIHIRPGHSFGHRFLSGVTVLLVAFVVFVPVISFDLLMYDDDINIIHNPYLHTLEAARLGTLWLSPYLDLYIPVTYTTWGIIAAISRLIFWGHLDPVPFHAANLLLHLANIYLVFSIIFLLLRRKDGSENQASRPWIAGLGALFFGIHPVMVEPVAWATGMKDLLSACFALATLRIWLGFQLDNHHLAGAKRGLVRGLMFASYLLALLAKPSAVVVPVFMLILLVWMEGKWSFKPSMNIAIFFVLAIACAALTRWAQSTEETAILSPLFWRPLIAVDAVMFYLGKLVLPLNLIPDYGRTPEVVMSGGFWTYLFPILFIGFIGAILLTKDRKTWLVCLGLFIAGILPVSGIMPFSFQKISTVADRYLYLSMMGPAIAFAWLLRNQAAHRFSFFSLSAVLMIYAFLTFFQISIWKGNDSLMRHTLQKNPTSSVAKVNLAVLAIRKGENDKALPFLEEVLENRPDHVTANINLGIVHMKKGNLDEAIGHFKVAAEKQPNFDGALVNLGIAYEKKRQYDEALDYFRKALSINPYNEISHCRTGQIYFLLGNPEKAVRYLAGIYQNNPWMREVGSMLRMITAQSDREKGKPAAKAVSFIAE